MQVSVIIVSAGKSTRMGGIDKQFVPICDIPVLIRSIQAFDNINEVFEIIVVTNHENEIAVNKLISNYNFSKNIVIAIGGKTRQESYNFV